jgi:hypothetical protein
MCRFSDQGRTVLFAPCRPQSELHSSDERICYPDLPYCPDRKAAEMIAAEGRKTPQSGLMGDNQNSPWGVSIVAHQACVIHHHRMLDMLS